MKKRIMPVGERWNIYGHLGWVSAAVVEGQLGWVSVAVAEEQLGWVPVAVAFKQLGSMVKFIHFGIRQVYLRHPT